MSEKDNTKYSFNSKTNLAKRNLAKEVIKKYLQDNPNKDYEELREVFNFTASNNNPLILNDEKYKVWSNKRNDAESRYFDPIKYGIHNIYICSQWSINSIPSLIEFAKRQNYNIDEDNTKEVKTRTNKDTSPNAMNTKNIILYGAPGVGKTHNYKRLISMIEDNENEKDIFNSIAKNKSTDNFDNSIFDEANKDERIEFITFHQSYSYEDFIEGFRPRKGVKIKRKDGIFKLISDRASKNLDNSSKDIDSVQKNSNIKMQFENYISKKIGGVEKLKLQQGGEFELIEFKNDKLFFTTSKKSKFYTKFSLKYNDFIKMHNSTAPKNTLGDISKILETNAIQQKYAYYLQIYKDFMDNKNDINVDTKKINNKLKNFYLVIDEINRGNISKIFGELITLIEESKRDNYEVTLPYSKKKFKVPSNLYIIATMNSTDKSIATVDIALRRRFTFLKMKPKLKLVNDEKAKEFMRICNKYIKKERGEDYMLGHSYFMGENVDLEFIVEYKIKPLLEEYFYAEDKSVSKVLGEILKDSTQELKILLKL